MKLYRTIFNLHHGFTLILNILNSFLALLDIVTLDRENGLYLSYLLDTNHKIYNDRE